MWGNCMPICQDSGLSVWFHIGFKIDDSRYPVDWAVTLLFRESISIHYS